MRAAVLGRRFLATRIDPTKFRRSSAAPSAPTRVPLGKLSSFDDNAALTSKLPPILQSRTTPEEEEAAVLEMNPKLPPAFRADASRETYMSMLNHVYENRRQIFQARKEGNSMKADRLAQEAEAFTLACTNPKDLAYAASLCDRALTLRDTGDFEESVKKAEMVVRMLELNSDQGSVKTRALARENQAASLRMLAQKAPNPATRAAHLRKALDAHQLAYNELVELFGIEHADSAVARWKLGNVYKDFAEFDIAEKHVRAALAVLTNAEQSKKHVFSLAGMRNDLALILKLKINLGNKDPNRPAFDRARHAASLSEAMELMEQALRLTLEMQGPASRDAIVYRHNLAELLEASGEKTKANEIRESILKDLERKQRG